MAKCVVPVQPWQAVHTEQAQESVTVRIALQLQMLIVHLGAELAIGMCVS